MRKLNIGVDLDGVCYPFTEALRHYLIEHEGFHPDSVAGGGHDADESCWDFYKKYWDMTTEDFLEYSNRGVDAGVVFLHGDPFPDTVETLSRLHDAGHKIHIITNRSFGSRSHHNTSDWLTQHGIPYDTLAFSADKTIMRVDLFIDDYEENFKDLWNAGIETYLFDRPWNRHVDTMMPRFLKVAGPDGRKHELSDYRVKTWEEFEVAVNRKAGAL
jgi:5'(3')-deoxyribonucleotidase